jgi:hypothetical protein
MYDLGSFFFFFFHHLIGNEGNKSLVHGQRDGSIGVTAGIDHSVAFFLSHIIPCFYCFCRYKFTLLHFIQLVLTIDFLFFSKTLFNLVSRL